jgi:integrase/recombinase XerD
MAREKMELFERICNGILYIGQKGTESRQKLLELLQDYKIDRLEQSHFELNIYQIIDLYLEKRSSELNKKTINQYRYQLKLFANFIEKKVTEITSEDINVFLLYKGNIHKNTAFTISNHRRIIKSFFKWLETENIVLDNPMHKIAPIEHEEPDITIISKEELTLLRKACIDDRERAIIEVLYCTGCLLNEIVNMNIEDINWNDTTIKIKSSGYRERVVYLSEEAVTLCKNYLSNRDDNYYALFVTERKPHNRLQNRGMQKIFNRITSSANLEKKITPNTFRVSFYATMLNNGCPLTTVKELIGQKSFNKRMDTYKRVEKNKKQAIEKYLKQPSN